MSRHGRSHSALTALAAATHERLSVFGHATTPPADGYDAQYGDVPTGNTPTSRSVRGTASWRHVPSQRRPRDASIEASGTIASPAYGDVHCDASQLPELPRRVAQACTVLRDVLAGTTPVESPQHGVGVHAATSRFCSDHHRRYCSLLRVWHKPPDQRRHQPRVGSQRASAEALSTEELQWRLSPRRWLHLAHSLMDDVPAVAASSPHWQREVDMLISVRRHSDAACDSTSA